MNKWKMTSLQCVEFTLKYFCCIYTDGFYSLAFGRSGCDLKMYFSILFSSDLFMMKCPEINSSHPNAAYMPQWIGSALVKIMACSVAAYSAPSHYLNQCCVIVNWTLRNKLQWNSNQNIKLFIHENAFENIVCDMVAILSWGRWVNARGHWFRWWLGAVRQQASAWANVNPVLFCHVVSLGHNELTRIISSSQ